jgi:uncharacterized membrane protein
MFGGVVYWWIGELFCNGVLAVSTIERNNNYVGQFHGSSRFGRHGNLLGVLLRSRTLKSWFGSSLHQATDQKIANEDPQQTPSKAASSVIFASVVAYGVVEIARRIEQMLAHVIPGTSCGVIACLTPIVQRCLSSNQRESIQAIAAPMSEICFLVLFSAVGVSANIGAAVRNGPACLLFSLVALLVHVIVTIAGSSASRRWSPSLGLEEALVASNAAIGGPGTAAAFCGQLTGPNKQLLTVAATLWGVVGYAIGTTIGVLMFGMLRQLV